MSENKDAVTVDEAKVVDPVPEHVDAPENGTALDSDDDVSDVEADDEGLDDGLDDDDDEFEDDEFEEDEDEEYEDDDDPNAEGRRMLAELVEDGDVETDDEDDAFDGNVVAGKKRKVGEADGDLVGDAHPPPKKRVETEDDAEE
ncbi:hypothetical protein CcaverHIS002_0206570 [Cutaneotrichosporon cavernicola]|uniref:Uncharacterized protein n=1 Tax=Cutaneotrichosporon cavernicola TaxID=279322 RepID=A0AA48IFL8_9TREE|nr:uncharacterized protein CcaverHIS019_0206550 [Cutaneotrichosporon cavernicola]BEI81497.1 hypothetical protein CcaverHIS002_0206570 [Cutaneotrichosporon cavernicola]BEI89293.1 hypothetical protein CcaverHIS019_0206550 [Cutaneotrichosporon cavernicola]BEI97069.1 hypothetical protein CcaverHIS631_0206580 [Cutaneotrichosporon cavernicola]BEJ04842.1 hypothetical protein CcaverHIS641_0206590 [Cutaneotrichosporon cavernicola]